MIAPSSAPAAFAELLARATTERTLKDALQQFEQHRAEIAKRCTDVAHVAQTPSEDTPAEGLQNRTNSLDLVN